MRRVSTSLNAGVPSTQVAEWAGHSLAVLLQIYAKCVVGQEEDARGRIDAVLGARMLETSVRVRYGHLAKPGARRTPLDRP